MQYTITMADVCELAHELTIKKLGDKAEKIIRKANNTEVKYTKIGQETFNQYYNLITNTFSI